MKVYIHIIDVAYQLMSSKYLILLLFSNILTHIHDLKKC